MGEAVEELDCRETQGCAAGGVRSRQDVENLVRAVADQVEPFEGKGRPGTIPDQPFEPLPVGGLDADAAVQAKATPVIPGEHVQGLVGFQEAVAAKVAQYPFSHRVLEALQETGGEGGGLVETEAGVRVVWVGRYLIRIRTDPLEEAVDDEDVEVEMGVQRRAEAVEETDRADGG